MSVQHNVRLTPINFIDCNAADQIVNAIIFQECGRHNTLKDWAMAVQSQIRDYNITLGISRIMEIIRDLKRGQRRYDASTIFKGKVAARSGKDKMYAEFDAMVRLAHQGIAPRYVGLPANQVLSVHQRYGSVVACERDKKTRAMMERMVGCFQPDADINIMAKDILDYLSYTRKKFTVYDFDLMCGMSRILAEKLARRIYNTMGEIAVVCIVSCVGRKNISIKEYSEMMPQVFVSSLRRRSLQVEHLTFRDGKVSKYNDGISPMCYDHFLVRRQGEKLGVR